MLAEPQGDLANRVNHKLDPIACYKNVAVGAFAVGGLLWLVGGWALALSWLAAEPANALRAPAPTPPVLVGCMTLAVATILVGAVFWTAAAHREWAAGLVDGHLAAQDAKLDGLTELLGQHIEALRHYNTLLEQQGQRPARSSHGRSRRPRIPRQSGVVVLPPEVADLTARLDRRLAGSE